MIGRSVVIGVALAVSMATAAQAKMPDYAHQGLYLQGNVGFINQRGGGSSAALGLTAGIDIVDHVSMEIQFEAIPTLDTFVITFQQRTRILTGRWQPYLKGGIGWGGGSGIPSNIAIRVGGGLDYMINKHVSVGVETSFVAIKDGLHYGSFGLGLRYGW